MIVKLKSPTLHAIRILKYLGENQNVVCNDICKKVGLTPSYFMRIVRDLKRARILISVQGRYGGFSLGRRLDDISLYEVIMAMEEDDKYDDEVGIGSLYQILEEMEKGVSEHLKQVSLNEL